MHQTPDFINSRMNKRKIKTRLRGFTGASIATISQLKEISITAGAKSFYEVVNACCNDEGKTILLTQLKESSIGYNSKLIEDMAELNSTIQEACHRHGPSAKRFSCLIDDSISEDGVISSGKYFVVVSRNTNMKEVVYVSNYGYFANMGSPDYNILNVYLSGYCLFNPLAHLHAFYLRPNFDMLTIQQKAKYTVKMNICGIPCDSLNLDNSWDLCITATEKKWQIVGLNTEAHHELVNPPTTTLKRSFGSKLEVL